MSQNSGFTLIELILVTVLIGILAGAIVQNYPGYVTKTKIARAQADIATLVETIQTYAITHNDKCPSSLEVLASEDPPLIRGLSRDPWGNPYVYQPATSPTKVDFTVYSAGPDGSPGTEDDVTEDLAYE